MDYRTLFVTFLASLTVYTACASALAWRNREVRGLSWIAGSLICVLFGAALQCLQGKIPTFFSSFFSNELYFPAYALQMLGLTWFVEPKRRRWKDTLLVVAFFALLYAALYAFHISYISNVIDAPTIGFIAATIWILLTAGRGIFARASRLVSVFLLAEIIVLAYRAVLTNYIYADPWLVFEHQHDRRWLYSTMLLLFFSTCVIMCEFWFFVLELQRELIEQAHTDSLTGALNRRALYEVAEREIGRGARSEKPLCLLLFDIDDFKTMNDNYGHAAGDEVLIRLVKEIKASLRSHDILARTGGEEFAVLLPETSLPMAQIVAERIRKALGSIQFRFSEASCRMSVSIGLVEVAGPDSPFDHVLQRADSAMYAAKRAGKNRVVARALEAAPVTASARFSE